MALSCKFQTSVNPICDTSLSGIKKMAFVNYDINHTFTASGTDCMIDTIDLGTDYAYEINVADLTGYFSFDGFIGASPDQKAFNHIVGGLIPNLNCEFLADYKNFFLGTATIFVMDKNNQVWVLGVDNGLKSGADFSYSSGTAEADAKGLTFVYQGTQPNPALMVRDWSTVTALYNPAP